MRIAARAARASAARTGMTIEIPFDSPPATLAHKARAAARGGCVARHAVRQRHAAQQQCGASAARVSTRIGTPACFLLSNNSPRFPQTTEELGEALKAFSQHLPAVSAEGEEDGSPRGVAAPAADAAQPPPFLTSAWPAERAQQRAFLAQTAVSWALIALVLAAYVQLLSAMGRGEAVFLALRPWLGVSKARFKGATASACAWALR